MFLVSGGLQKKPGDVFSSSLQELRFRLLFCLVFSDSRFLWSEKKKSSFLSPHTRPIWHSPDGALSYHPHSRSSPSFVPVSFPPTEPSDLLQCALLSLCAAHTAARTRLYRGCIQDHNLPEHTPCESGWQTKAQKRIFVTSMAPFPTHRTGQE